MKKTLESRIADSFAMSEETWQRHANPWSVWTRFTVLPLICVAIWSRSWIGSWAWIPVLLSLLWTWLNPRLFPRPASTDHWSSRAVLGERVWLNRKNVEVPEHHRMLPNLLNGVAASGLLFLIPGLWMLNLWATLMGILLVFCGKLWFLDRMVWLYQDMNEASEEYSSWLY